ncbi:MAG: hypothetical protein ACUVQY_05835, partial [Thermoproteota archaeon]
VKVHVMTHAVGLALTGHWPMSCSCDEFQHLPYVYGEGVLRTKTLYTNICYFDCKYCINSVHGRMTYSYAPEGLAKLFHLL